MHTIDLHTHTRFFHGFNSRPTPYDPVGVRLLVRVAAHHNLDAIALTNHDYYASFDIDPGDVTIIPGIEITTTLGHMLVVGPDPPTSTIPRKLTPAETVERAHENGCAAIVAHPFRNSTVIGADADFDALEVNGKRGTTVDQIHSAAAECNKPLVGGSDAHYPFEVGRTFTEIDVDELTPEAVAAAIRNGKVRYKVDERHPSQFLRHVYRLIHRAKGHTTPREPAAD